MNETKKSFLKFPTYTDIFKNGQEKIIANLSQEGLAEKYIVFTTSISSLLYVSHFKSFHVQELIMMEFKDVLLGTDDGRLIVDWLLSNNQKTLNINNYTLMEMYGMLLKYKKGLCGNDNVSLTKDEQLLYLKLVLIANERRTNSMEKVHKNLDSIIRNDKFEYEKMFWPILLQETDINEVPRIEYEMFRIKYFVEGVINKYPKAEAIIDKFFQRKGFDNYRLYASYLASFFMKFITSYTNDGELRPGIKENEQNRKLFAPLVVNDTIPKTYLELKSHPVYYFNGGYYVIHWNYLINQIFIGMFMALKNELNECGLQDIKKECGKIIEHTLFKNVLITAFSNSWQRYAFDNEDKGMPDAIFRMGNNLFILELKDNLMGEDVMESFDYTYIESHINRNFIQSERGKKKGIKQLAAYIKTFINNGYEAIGAPYSKKLNIYPIIIYTDYKYKLNGLNHYLSIKFDEVVNSTEISANRRIKPLTVIGLDCLFNLQYKFQKKELKFAAIIDQYHRYVKNRVKKNAYRGIEKFGQLYPSFDRYLPENRNFFMYFSDADFILRDFFS